MKVLLDNLVIDAVERLFQGFAEKDLSVTLKGINNFRRLTGGVPVRMLESFQNATVIEVGGHRVRITAIYEGK